MRICRNMFLFWDTMTAGDLKEYKNEIVEITMKVTSKKTSLKKP